MNITINQAIDKLTNKPNLNDEQNKLKDSLIKFKLQFGGNTIIENSLDVNNIIELGIKKGKG